MLYSLHVIEFTNAIIIYNGEERRGKDGEMNSILVLYTKRLRDIVTANWLIILFKKKRAERMTWQKKKRVG